MEHPLLPLELVSFALAWWLGLYLLSRDVGNGQLRNTGLGLAFYALGLASSTLAQQTTDPQLENSLARWGWPLLFLPAIFWFGTLYYLLPAGHSLRKRLDPVVAFGLIPLAFLLYLLAGGTDLIVTTGSDGLKPGPWYAVFAGLILLELLIILYLVLRGGGRAQASRPTALVVVATLFFALGTGLLLFPLALFPRWLLVLAMGGDLVLLGLAIAILDAFSQGEALLPDFARSLAVSSLVVLLFGGQVALVIILSTGLTFTMLLLLIAVIVTAIFTQTFADPLHAGLDWLIFARVPRIRQIRADLRAAASGAPRSRETLDPHSLTEEQFVRLTRRALGQLGNLPRLAASPLTRLNVIETRLAADGRRDGTLERAAELKSLLSESIDRLKPRDQGDFGTTDEWRYYNALYFPYVAGLKPYSRRAIQDQLDPTEQAALEWFRVQVPERTLYNWQTAAAGLVAQDLKEYRDRLTGN